MKTTASFVVRAGRFHIGGLRYKSSLSALAYKQLHRHAEPLSLPTLETPDWSTKAVISSILTELPGDAIQKKNVHILQCLVQNEMGVLSLVAGQLAARGFNIDSLIVSSTEVPDLSRMTIALQGHRGIVEKARRQVEDLVPVWAVLDYTDTPIIQRELLLVKVSLLGPEYFGEVVSHHKKAQSVALGELPPSVSESFPIEDYHPKNLPLSEALRHKHMHMDAIKKLAEHYGGKIADISDRSCIVELTASADVVSTFLHHVKPFGVLEVVRTGVTAMSRTTLDIEAEDELSEDAAVEAAIGDLPPG